MEELSLSLVRVVVSGTGRGAGFGVPSVDGSPLGGAGVVNTGFPFELDPTSSAGLSGSSTVSTVWRLVAFLSASYYWS